MPGSRRCKEDDEWSALWAVWSTSVGLPNEMGHQENWSYWPTMLEDCFQYYKGCQDCQKFGNVQRVPASALNPIIKPWPFRGWGIDLIDQINPPSSKGHKFVLLATDYFTKWVEAIPLKKVTS
jgi:hypothetical protein